MYSNNQFQKHAVLACQFSCYIRNSFFANLVNIFDVQSYVEVSLGRIVLHFTWGIELSTLLEEHEKKDLYMQMQNLWVESSLFLIELWFWIYKSLTDNICYLLHCKLYMWISIFFYSLFLIICILCWGKNMEWIRYIRYVV